MLEKADIIGEFVGALRDPGKNREHTAVDLSGIRLSGYREALGESHLRSDPSVRLAALLMIPVKEFQEACLGSCRSLGAK